MISEKNWIHSDSSALSMIKKHAFETGWLDVLGETENATFGDQIEVL